MAGRLSVNGSAVWDPATGDWEPFGIANVTRAIVRSNGNLVVVSFHRPREHDGTSWQLLGTANSGTFKHVIELANGGLAVVGTFPSVNGVAANGVAVYQGGVCSPVGVGLNFASAIAEDQNGNLIVAGPNAQGLQRWNGFGWAQFTAGVDNSIEDLVVMPNGDLVAGGYVSTAGGQPASAVARWDGTDRTA